MAVAKNTVNFSVESFSVEKKTPAKEKKEGVTLTGFALPFDTTSRNGFSYRKESIEKNAKSMEGRPMFFNHVVESIPIGKVEAINITEKGMEYRATLNPVTEEGKNVVEAVKNGLIENVSIQCMYENAKLNEKNGTFEVDVSEFLELSVVTIPGFAETTAMAHEKLKTSLKLKEQAVAEIPETSEEVEGGASSDDEQMEKEMSLEEVVTMLNDYIKNQEQVMTDMENKIAALQATVDSMVEEEEAESNGEEESEEKADEENKEQSEEMSDKDNEEKSEEASDDEEEDKAEESFERTTVLPTCEETVKNVKDSSKLLAFKYGL